MAYLTGFGNEHETEALEGALPRGRFSPQKVAYGLYAEQFSSTAFTVPRALNRRSWFYRIRPSVLQGEFEPYNRPRRHRHHHSQCVALGSPAPTR